MLSPRLLELLREWWLQWTADDVAVSGPRSAAADHDAPALSGRVATRRMRWGSRSACRRTRCGTASRRICWSRVSIFA